MYALTADVTRYGCSSASQRITWCDIRLEIISVLRHSMAASSELLVTIDNVIVVFTTVVLLFSCIYLFLNYAVSIVAYLPVDAAH